MNKFISLLAIAGFSASALFAQTTVKIAPEIGGSFVTMSQKYAGSDYETDYQPAFRIGGVVDLGFINHFSLQPGAFMTFNNGTESNFQLNYSTGGGVPASTTDDRIYHITYLQIPVYALYKTGDEFSPHFFAGAGPYLNIALGGRFQQNFTNTLNGQSIVKRFDFPMDIGSEQSDQIRRLDFGFQATAGFETTFGLYFRVFYGFGLLNTSPIANSDNIIHQSGGGLSIGYFFKVNNQEKY